MPPTTWTLARLVDSEPIAYAAIAAERPDAAVGAAIGAAEDHQDLHADMWRKDERVGSTVGLLSVSTFTGCAASTASF